jgi:hypothetical protein
MAFVVGCIVFRSDSGSTQTYFEQLTANSAIGYAASPARAQSVGGYLSGLAHPMLNQEQAAQTALQTYAKQREILYH